MYYPSVQDVQIAVKKLNKHHGINITVINEGQLKFALEKPRMQIYGHEQYPELYQKAAVLMEGLTKIHALSDGNKRCAMLIAGLLIKANGAELVLPLKTIQLSVDTAMDDKDEMTEEIQQWFKIHIANNIDQLSIRLTENMEEEAIITNLLDQEKHSEADNLVDRWMVFNSYPEHRTTWEELKKRWKNKDLDRQKNNQSSKSTVPEIPENMSDDNSMHSRHSSEGVRKISDLKIVDHTLEELVRYEKLIKRSEELLANTKNVQLLMGQAYVLERSRKFKEALEVQQGVLKIDPTQHHAYFHMGLMYRYGQDHQKSAESFRKCLELNPTEPYARRGIAIALMHMNRNKEALKEINRSIEIESEQSEPYYIKSTIQARLKDFDSAEKTIRHALKKQPTNLDYLITLGQILLEIGEYDKAIEVYQKAENIEPKSMAHVYNIAYAYDKTKNYDMVIKLYSTALQNNPGDSKALIYMGGMYSNKGEYKKALQCLKKGLVISPKNKIGLKSMVITLGKMGEYDKAIKYLNQCIELDPRESELHYEKSGILARLGNFNSAKKSIKHALKMEPTNSKYLILLGRILSEIGEHDKVFEMCQKATNIEPESMVHVHHMAYRYDTMKNYDMVIKLCNMLLQKKPDDSEALIYVGVAYVNKGEYKKALQYLKRGLARKPMHKTGLAFMAIVLGEIGESNKAMEYIDRLIELDREDMQPVIVKSMILVEQNKIDDALELVEKIVKKDPDAKKMIRNASEFSTIRNSELFKRLTE